MKLVSQNVRKQKKNHGVEKNWSKRGHESWHSNSLIAFPHLLTGSKSVWFSNFSFQSLSKKKKTPTALKLALFILYRERVWMNVNLAVCGVSLFFLLITGCVLKIGRDSLCDSVLRAVPNMTRWNRPTHTHTHTQCSHKPGHAQTSPHKIKTSQISHQWNQKPQLTFEFLCLHLFFTAIYHYKSSYSFSYSVSKISPFLSLGVWKQMHFNFLSCTRSCRSTPIAGLLFKISLSF